LSIRCPKAFLCVLFQLCSFFFFALFFPALSSADDPLIEVKGLRHWSTPEYIRIVMDLSAPVEFAKGTLSNPDRLYFDLKNARFAKEVQKNIDVSGPLLKTVRTGQNTPTTARIVFVLGTGDYDYKVFNLEDPARLVVDILPKGPSDKKPELKSEPATGGKPEVRPEPKPDIKPDIKPDVKPDIKPDIKPDTRTEAGLLPSRRIVIDPGHGGHDPGAVGLNGLYEKDIVLDVALRVREIMKREYPAYEVILTRDKDVFIPLPERAKIANRNDADFFLSIHANASPNRQARGIETYFLNWTDDETALRVAARENAISVKQMKQVQSEMDVILASLDRDRKRDDSLKLAGYIQQSMVSTMSSQYQKIQNLGVKSALFYVLVGAKMSSALAEISFVSNPEEEKLLRDEAYRDMLARSLVNGVNAYFSAAPPAHLVAYRIPSKDNVPAASEVKANTAGKAKPARTKKAKHAKYARKAR